MFFKPTSVHLIAVVLAVCTVFAQCRVLHGPRGEREVSGAAATGTRSSDTSGQLQKFKDVCSHSETAFIDDAISNLVVIERYKTFGDLSFYEKPGTGNFLIVHRYVHYSVFDFMQLLKTRCVEI